MCLLSVFLHKVFLKEFEEFTSGHCRCIVTVSGIYKIVVPPNTDLQNRSNAEQRIDYPLVHFLSRSLTNKKIYIIIYTSFPFLPSFKHGENSIS